MARKVSKISAGTGTAVGSGSARGDGRAHPLDKRLTALLAHGDKFPPGDTYDATEQHMAKAAERHRRVVEDLKALLRQLPEELRCKNGRINAAKLAEAYAKCPDGDLRQARLSKRHIEAKVIPRHRAELQRFADENLPPVLAE